MILYNMTYQIYMALHWTQGCKTILNKKNKAVGTSSPGFRIYYKATTKKSKQHNTGMKAVAQINGTEWLSQLTTHSLYVNYSMAKMAKNIQWKEKDSLE